MWDTRKEEHLHFLRAFRDNVLADSEAGRDYIFMLYNNSLEILIFLIQNPLITEETTGVIDELLPGIQLLLDGGEMSLSKKQLTGVESLLSKFEIKASPKLRAAIKKVKKDISEGNVLKQLGISVIE